ncbi:GNAT family N-acetyltransferase [Pseudonocardia sp. CA-142604]|uniref:GNAT family N-acetyltransferase n=1 Tax=Pseudonocardia sp. CA-142604 TaxID=3240024 RepID=UPI003D940328
MSLPVRLATEADVGAIFSMRRAREVWLATRGIRQWPIGMVSIDHVTTQVRGEQWWVLAPPAAELLAAMRVIWSDEEFWTDTPGKAVYVHGLMVGSEHSRRGLGRVMLDAARGMGLDAGAEYFRLDCSADNETLKAIYRGYGFTEVGRKDFSGFSAALMELPLSPRTARATTSGCCSTAQGPDVPHPPSAVEG